MDFVGVLVPCSDNNNNTATTTNALFSASSEAVSDAEAKQKWHGSVGFLKQQANHTTEDEMRDSKMAKTTAATLPRSPFLGSDAQQMLCFSSPYYHPAASFGGNSGYGITGLNGANMHGLKGPFTPSQWMELEHQALIYKYITANVQIPPYLLNPIRKAIESAALSTFGLRASSLGWGGFHLGFSNSTDPEPGRCRRTDGKKWRCSRDAVADQKYCERHMNRGRHRSRKPVEPPSGPTKLIMPPATSSTPSAAADVSVGFSHHNNHLSNLQLPASHLDRSFLDKEYAGERYQDPTGLTITSSILKEGQYSMSKEQNPYEELKFGLVSSDSLLNPMSKENKSEHPIRQFMDDWPKNQSDRSMVGWPEMQQSDSTQLSISIPVATSEFMSSTPANEKLSWEIEATQMRLGVGTVNNEQNRRQGNWIPIPWEASMGGPLGEVFHGTNSSPKPASSPTGVLQKAVFYSASNSSAGSSPRAESYSILGPTLMNPSSLPAL